MQVAEDACTHLEDELLFCEDCRLYFRDSCPQHGPPTFVVDTPVPERAPSRALLSLPEGLLVKERSQGGLGVWSAVPALPRGCIFGPYEGEVAREHRDCTRYSWAVRNNGSYFFIDASDDSKSNWMRYVACASTEDEQNLTVFQYRGYIYYRVCQIIPADTELLVWIGEEYARTLGLRLACLLITISTSIVKSSHDKIIKLQIPQTHPFSSFGNDAKAVWYCLLPGYRLNSHSRQTLKTSRTAMDRRVDGICMSCSSTEQKSLIPPFAEMFGVRRGP